GCDRSEVRQLERRFDPVDALSGLPLLVGEVASVVGGGHAESDLVLLAAWDCPRQADASTRIEAKAIHARITKADLAEHPQLAADIVSIHDGVTDHVRPDAPVLAS